ncbi:MAG: dihydrodipicolinate synthase family protein [Treponemataceae bacterium]
MIDKSLLRGVYAPMCTPFIDDEINFAGLEKNIEKMNASGLRGYFILGTNGEYRTLSEEEQFKIVDVFVKKASKDKVVMAGTGAESTRETIRLTRKAADRGAAMASLLMPNFFAKKITDDVMIRHAIAVADASPIPVMLYNNPSVSAGVTISAKVLDATAGHPNIAGIKDSGKDTWETNVKYDADDFSVLAGSASYFFDLIRLGGTGGVLSLANVIPDACAALYRLCVEGKKDEALALRDTIESLNKLISGSFGVAGVKAAMDIVGFSGGTPRSPLSGITKEEKEGLAIALKESSLMTSALMGSTLP